MTRRNAKKATGTAAGVPKRARSTMEKSANINTANINTEQEEEEEMPNVFSHEIDSLECDICFMSFESQVYTCKNGHAACGKCCISMNRKCSCCNEPIGDFRCRATEKILAGMTRPCRFKKNGCNKIVRFTEMRSHEEEGCQYAPYRCPFNGCSYTGMQLYGHIEDYQPPPACTATTSPISLLRRTTVTLQKGEPFRALLHRDRVRVFLLINGGDVLTGRSLSVIRICPHPTEEDDGVETGYKMEVKGGEPESLSLTASGMVQYVRRLEGFKPRGFLFVPDAFWGSSGSVSVTLEV